MRLSIPCLTPVMKSTRPSSAPTPPLSTTANGKASPTSNLNLRSTSARSRSLWSEMIQETIKSKRCSVSAFQWNKELIPYRVLSWSRTNINSERMSSETKSLEGDSLTRQSPLSVNVSTRCLSTSRREVSMK